MLIFSVDFYFFKFYYVSNENLKKYRENAIDEFSSFPGIFGNGVFIY